ncbi:multidrug export protein EmrB [Lentilactobacillus sunkii]|jgi:EmrB/QacA subfamily drug resistance transporter|uniref:Multidrug export protein EmrB n=1 Tax=Lentilactobacillus sunkii TaxID=481719 RepID=A0A1E7X8P7_9LACO|nr:MFS transporter [Lentilactobacillus sunkii]OFA09332.1 multidrug export protein EmrB [Lentilactobacillus sunkii]
MSNSNEKISLQTYLALLAAALLSFTGILTETSMNVTFPELTRVFNVTLDTIQWITTGYLLMVTIVMATTAFLLKKFKSQTIHLSAAIAFVIGDVMCALSPNFPILMSGRLIQAIATGLSTPLMFHIIFSRIPAQKVGAMTGLAGMVISLAPALGPTYGGTISSLMSWRMIFWLILPIIVVSWWLGSHYIRIDPVGTGSFDVLSLGLLAATLFSLVFDVSKAGKYDVFSSQVLIPFMIGLIALGLFIYSDTHGSSQLLDIRVLKWLSTSLSAFTYFVLQFVNIGVSFLIPVYCQYALHSSPFIAGLVLLPGSLVGAAISPFAGRLADVKGYALPIYIGLCSMTLGGLIFFGIQEFLTAWIILLVYSFLRFGFNMGFSNTISNAMLNVPHKFRTDINSLFSMLQQFAGSIGVGIMAAVMAINQNNGVGNLAARSFTGGRYDFLLATMLSAAALIAAIINFRIQKHKAELK